VGRRGGVCCSTAVRVLEEDPVLLRLGEQLLRQGVLWL